MATKDNFVKALKELTGFDEENSGIQSEIPAAEGNFEQKLQEAAAETVSTVKEEAIVKPEIAPVAEPVFTRTVETERFSVEIEKPLPKGGTTKITENMVVIGDINSNDKIEIMGRVRGDIQTSDDLVVEGIIEGGISGRNMLLQGSALKGNLLASGDVAIETGSIIVGNVQAENVKLDGKVKGNIFVGQMTQLTENALLVGDVETTGIAASVGSRIKGSIITKELNNVSEDEEFEMEV